MNLGTKAIFTYLLLIILVLLRPNNIVADDASEITVRVGTNSDDTITLVGNSQELGDLLKQNLSALESGTYCWVYAQAETLVIAEGITVVADNLNLVMRNVTIKAHEDLIFSHIIRFSGSNNTIFGVKVQGPDNRELHHPTKGHTSGIHVSGTNAKIISCESSNMPNGPNGAWSHCFWVTGNGAEVSCCTASNPGYDCYSNRAANASYDRIESFIDSPTSNGYNRFFNSHGNENHAPGILTVRNAKFTASYDADTPNELRQAVVRIGSHQLFEMSDTDIELGENVNNAATRNHTIKLSTLLREARLNNVTIESENPSFIGHNLSLASRQPPNPMVSSDETVLLDCKVTNCSFDHGIIALVAANSLDIRESSIGTLQNNKHYLFQGMGKVKDIRMEDTVLANSGTMLHFGGTSSSLPDSKITLRNVDFTSATRVTSFVFHGNNNTYPRRASFLDAIDFTYDKSPDAVNPLYLASGRINRLAMTSASSDFDEDGNGDPDGDSLRFDSRFGVQGVTSGHTMLGPPFREMPGVDGDRIYPHPGNNPSLYGWGNAQYWEFKNSVWEPYFGP